MPFLVKVEIGKCFEAGRDLLSGVLSKAQEYVFCLFFVYFLVRLHLEVQAAVYGTPTVPSSTRGEASHFVMLLHEKSN